MNFNCENCGWSEIIGSPIMCNYSGHRTWRDECCEAWKPKKEETNMVEVVRCADCKYSEQCIPQCEDRYCAMYYQRHDGDWFCADGKKRNDDDA